MKELVVNILKRALREYKYEITEEEIINLLEIPPNTEMGDYALPCFSFAKTLNMNPSDVALEIRQLIGTPNGIDFDDITTSGSYVNFFINRKELAIKTIHEIISKGEKYGRVTTGKREKVVIDFSSPNIGKPFGIGHLRSTIIGNSIANISEFVGYKSIRENYLGDWGTQFGKLIFAFQKWGDEEKLKKDTIKYLLELYVKASKNEEYEEPSRACFKALENKDKKSVALWKKFRRLSLEDFNKVYKEMGVSFDEITGESLSISGAKKVIKELEEKKLLIESEGALGVDLEKYGLGFCMIAKTDGTTTYASRDLSTILRRYKKYKFARMIYEVGQEQKLHFQQVFKVLDLMGYEWAKDCVHVYHGLYMGKDKKKLATRKGKTIFMQDILNDTKEHAKKEIKKRMIRITEKELERRAKKVAIAAIIYGDLKNNRTSDMIFNSKKFVSFEGDTGPYLLYSYARATSIIKKAKAKNKNFKIIELKDKESELIKKLSSFRQITLDSYSRLSPSIIAHYSYELAQIFNEFYHSCQVIGSEEESFRLALVEAFRVVLKSSLELLGIEPIKEM